MRQIIVCLDSITVDSLKSSPVLHWTLSNILKAQDTLTLVYGSKTLYETPGQISATASTENISEMQQVLVGKTLELINLAGLKDITVKANIASADPRDFIVGYAKEIDASLVVCGSRGQKGIKKLLLGSVSEYLVGHCECNVLVCKRF